MNYRIKKARRALDLTQQTFAEKIGMKQNSIALIESGKRNISDQAILSICREFNVNEEWLRTGNGEMFNPNPSDTLEQLAKEYQLSNAAYVMLEKFIALRPEIQNGIFNYIHEVCSALDGMSPGAPAYKSAGKAQLSDEIPQDHHKTFPHKNPESSTDELESEYKKSLSTSAQSTDSFVSNTTDGIEKAAGE